MFDKRDILPLKSKIEQIFKIDYLRIKHGHDYKSKKEDSSWVTEIDQLISNLVIDHFKNQNIHVISEESAKPEIRFPCIIVDPIDGTRELVKEVPEFCISFSYFESSEISDKANFSWIYNPVTGFEVTSDQVRERNKHFISDSHLRGFVSRSNYTKNISKRLLDEDLFISPFGSIALKLGMLSVGACNFVYSFKQKNIWDIAAGCHLAKLAGLTSLSQGSEIQKLDTILIEGPLLWARAEHLEQLQRVLCQDSK